MSQPIRQARRNDGSDTVRTIPSSDAQGLLGTPVPLRRDDGEQREAARLEEAQEEARGVERGEVVAGREGRRSNAPAEHEGGHEDAVGHAHDEEGREGLPGELRDGRHGPDQRVLVARQARVLHQPERRRVAEHRLVQDLQEVHPHQDGEDHLVRLPLDAPVLFRGVSE